MDYAQTTHYSSNYNLRNKVITGGRVNTSLAVNNATANPVLRKAMTSLTGIAVGLSAEFISLRGSGGGEALS